jgi:hypothetical protein
VSERERERERDCLFRFAGREEGRTGGGGRKEGRVGGWVGGWVGCGGGGGQRVYLKKKETPDTLIIVREAIRMRVPVL